MLAINPFEKAEFITIRISKDKTPIAFANKVAELVENGFELADAEKMADGMELECEIMYHKGYGIFAVESEAIGCGDIYSPYNQERAKDECNE